MSSAQQPIPIDLGVSEADLPKTLKVRLDPPVLLCSLCGSSMIGVASGRGGLAELMYCSNGSCLANKTTYRIPQFEVREVVRVPAKKGPPLILTAPDGPERPAEDDGDYHFPGEIKPLYQKRRTRGP